MPPAAAAVAEQLERRGPAGGQPGLATGGCQGGENVRRSPPEGPPQLPDAASCCLPRRCLPPQDDECFEVVPHSAFSISRTAHRSNASNYFINDRKSNFTEVRQGRGRQAGAPAPLGQ